MKNFKKIIYLMCALLMVVAACKEEEKINPGQPPTVSAGTDLTGTVGSTVTLNGTASDPDGDALTTSWSIASAPAGSSATVSSPSSLKASFVPDVAGPYTLKLTVDDGNYDPVSDEVIVTVEEAAGEPPVAAIQDKDGRTISADNKNNTVPVGTSYLLDASGSSDPDGDALTYAWAVTTAPDNADYALTESADKKQVTFAPKTTGNYVIKMTVTDATDNAVSAEVTLSVVAESILITQNVDKDTTWTDLFADPAMPDYIVKNSIDVNAKLTIAPGVVVHVDEDVIVTVASGGAMIAEGTQDKHIAFTSSDEAGQIYWGGLLFESSSTENILNYAKVSYGGGKDNLYVYPDYYATNISIDEAGKLKIANTEISNSEGDGLLVAGADNLGQFENNTFANNGGYALSVSINQVGTLGQTNTFSDNGDTPEKENRIKVFDRKMTTDQEWYALGEGTSYVFPKNQSLGKAVTLDAKLIIHEGAILEFGETVNLTVGAGVLTAKGTTEAPVTFTSANVGEGQNWGGLLVNSSSVNNELDHAQVLYAGGDDQLIYDYPSYYAGNVVIGENGKIKVTNTEIAYSIGHGLFASHKGIVEGFAGNNFHDNADYPMLLPANQVGMVDKATTFTANTDNVVAILESIFDDDAKFNNVGKPTWIALNGEARYLVLGKLTIESDLAVSPGAFMMVEADKIWEVTADGSLNATGTADSLIVFTAYNQDGNHNWGGLLLKSDNGNTIHYAQFSYAGSNDQLFYSYPDYYQAAIGVDDKASLAIQDTEITYSKKYGIAVHEGGAVNGLTHADANAATTVQGVNAFSNNASEPVIFAE